MSVTFQTFYNGMAIPLQSVPDCSSGKFLQGVVDAVDSGWRVSAYFGTPDKDNIRLYCLLSYKGAGMLGIMSTAVTKESLPSLVPYVPQLHLFEREIAEQFGLLFEDHPWHKPVRFQSPLFVPGNNLRSKRPDPGAMDFYQVNGNEIHEVAVGPVHAGIIEPGHFRFQCFGEQVLHLEISLGYQHRGIEQLLLGGPHGSTLYQAETIAGDTTIGHGQAYAMCIEALSGTIVPARAHAIRGIAMELERLANHTGDLGAIAGDVGYLPTASFCGRIRGDFLNMTAELCGNRFGRGLLIPGGVSFDCTPTQAEMLRQRLEAAREDLTSAVELLWNSPSVMGRLENTGSVSESDARTLGLVGPAARACGLNRDIRRDHPFGIYSMSQIPVVNARTGDVHARALIRWLEAEKSLDFIEEQLGQLPGGALRNREGNLYPNHVAVALTEGWRGEVCHVAITDDNGRFERYKITDPSFHNWSGLAMAMRNGQISDFPLCNKSFNLSYCGYDL
jgi:Ni,Fe-hydrogenase III large subunit